MSINIESYYIRDGRAPIPEKECTSRVMSANKAKNTKPELKLRKALHELGLRGYRVNYSQLPGKPDIAFTKKKVAIFVHGCFWHRCPICKPNAPKSHAEYWNKKFKRNIERDIQKGLSLKSLGWRVHVVWECQIKKKQSIDSIISRILHSLA